MDIVLPVPQELQHNKLYANFLFWILYNILFVSHLVSDHISGFVAIYINIVKMLRC
jgi:uncharacterized membrane protein